MRREVVGGTDGCQERDGRITFCHVIWDVVRKREKHMGKNKGAWYEPYKIVTPLTQVEIERRLMSEIAVRILLMRSKNDGFLSLEREISNGKFQMSTVMQRQPSQWNFFFLPEIVGDITETEDGSSMVLICLKAYITDLLIVFAVYTCVCILLQIGVFLYALILLPAYALIRLYWKLARNRFGERFEMLLRSNTQN